MADALTPPWPGSFAPDFGPPSWAPAPDQGDGRRRLPCPLVTVLPQDFTEIPGAQPIRFRSYDELAAAFPTYNAIDTEFAAATYDDIAQGHPGYPGGVPHNPTGTGIWWGTVDQDDTEFWLTDAEGLDDSPPWAATTIDIAGADGAWLEQVRAAAREVVLRGRIIATTVESLATAKNQTAGALSVPRTGILTYAGRRLPVALAGPTRIKGVGALAVDVEMTLRGVDLGPGWPGGGVFAQGAERTVTIGWNSSETFEVGGAVPTPPMIRVVGPTPAGIELDLSSGAGVTTITITQAIPAESTLSIDVRHRRITIDGRPRRAAVTLTQWPLLAVGANDAALRTPSPATGLVTVAATDLY